MRLRISPVPALTYKYFEWISGKFFAGFPFMTVTSFMPAASRLSLYDGMNNAAPSCAGISIVSRSGIFHAPFASRRKPSVIASRSSAASSARPISSRDSINMSGFSLSFALFETFNNALGQTLEIARRQQLNAL